MTEPQIMTPDEHRALFRQIMGRSPIELRNPWTGQVFWIERPTKEKMQ